MDRAEDRHEAGEHDADQPEPINDPEDGRRDHLVELEEITDFKTVHYLPPCCDTPTLASRPLPRRRRGRLHVFGRIGSTGPNRGKSVAKVHPDTDIGGILSQDRKRTSLNSSH